MAAPDVHRRGWLFCQCTLSPMPIQIGVDTTPFKPALEKKKASARA